MGSLHHDSSRGLLMSKKWAAAIVWVQGHPEDQELRCSGAGVGLGYPTLGQRNAKIQV